MARDADWRLLRDLPYSRKIGAWSEAEVYVPSTRELEAIARLPMLETLGSPMTIRNEDGLKLSMELGDPQIFLTERGGRIYIVNTEGYDYARYVLRIPTPNQMPSY